MLKFTLDERAHDRLKTRFETMRSSLNDLTDVWPEVHDVVTDLVKKTFLQTGSYAGSRWEKLSPRYDAWKKRTSGKTMMHLTERLYSSLTVPGHGERVGFYGKTFGEFGTSVPYAKAHQFGRPEINLPARVILPKLTKVERSKIADIVLAFILREGRRMRRAQ